LNGPTGMATASSTRSGAITSVDPSGSHSGSLPFTASLSRIGPVAAGAAGYISAFSLAKRTNAGKNKTAAASRVRVDEGSSLGHVKQKLAEGTASKPTDRLLGQLWQQVSNGDHRLRHGNGVDGCGRTQVGAAGIAVAAHRRRVGLRISVNLDL